MHIFSLMKLVPFRMNRKYSKFYLLCSEKIFYRVEELTWYGIQKKRVISNQEKYAYEFILEQPKTALSLFGAKELNFQLNYDKLVSLGKYLAMWNKSAKMNVSTRKRDFLRYIGKIKKSDKISKKRIRIDYIKKREEVLYRNHQENPSENQVKEFLKLELKRYQGLNQSQGFHLSFNQLA